MIRNQLEIRQISGKITTYQKVHKAHLKILQKRIIIQNIFIQYQAWGARGNSLKIGNNVVQWKSDIQQGIWHYFIEHFTKPYIPFISFPMGVFKQIDLMLALSLKSIPTPDKSKKQFGSVFQTSHLVMMATTSYLSKKCGVLLVVKLSVLPEAFSSNTSSLPH